MSKKFFEPTPEMNQLLSRAGSLQREESLVATSELAKALELPLRQGVMSGNILGDIFEAITLQPGATAEFPLDFQFLTFQVLVEVDSPWLSTVYFDYSPA